MSYLFDGPNKRIILEEQLGAQTQYFAVLDMYSRWKEWVAAGNAHYLPAFRSVAGDPIAPGKVIAPYVFLNTVDGWRIQPECSEHEIILDGNLYSENTSIGMFLPSIDQGTVNIIIERSSAAIGMDLGGGGAPSAEQVAAAVWSAQLQAYLDTLGSAGKSLRELFLCKGLDHGNPLVVDTVSGRRRVPADGSVIEQLITVESPGRVKLERT